MACRDTIGMNTDIQAAVPEETDAATPASAPETGMMFFGVDSATRADALLQNNLTQFEWATRNKMQPNYWGRYIGGENAVTAEEIDFLHRQGCKVAVLYNGYDKNALSLEANGTIDGKKAVIAASELGIPAGTAIFLEISAQLTVTDAYLKGFAKALIEDGYTPGFCANTDANFDFDHQFSRGCQNDPDIFGQCLIWAVSPSLDEYYQTTDAHLIHPDVWEPFCPSGMTRDQIAVWQYGRQCHPLHDHAGNPTSFDVSLVKDPSILIGKLY